MKNYVDLSQTFEQLVKLVKENKIEVQTISCEPHLQHRYITDDLKETERKDKLEYYEYHIILKENRK